MKKGLLHRKSGVALFRFSNNSTKKRTMRKIIEFFTSSDKQMHIAAGYIVTSGTFMFFSHWNADLAVFLGFLLGWIAGIGKEYFDYKHPETHCAEEGDLVADGIGIFIATALAVFSVCVG